MTRLLSPNKVDITPSPPSPSFFNPEGCKEMVANPSGVSPLSPHLQLSTDSPLPQGRRTSSATWGRPPPHAQLNMLTGRKLRVENHVVKTLHSVQRPSFFLLLRPENKKYPKSWKMTSINYNVNHYCSEQKVKLRNPLMEIVIIALTVGMDISPLLNYMWLNI